eukprot:gene44469-59339_t
MDKHTIMASAAIAALGFAGPARATADIFTQYQETGNGNTPRAIGKLFTNAGTCSASVISGNNIIVTAAHCCYNRSTDNWIGGWALFSMACGMSVPLLLTGLSAGSLLPR